MSMSEPLEESSALYGQDYSRRYDWMDHTLIFLFQLAPDVLTLYAAILPSSWCRGGNRGAHGA